MASGTENSSTWGFTKVTIAAGPTATSPTAKKIRSCKVFHYSGTATFVAPATDVADANDIPVPTSVAAALALPVNDLGVLSFYGTAGDVVGIIWRT